MQARAFGQHGVVVIGPHADNQNQHVDAHAQRTSRQRILSLDLHAAVDRRAGFRNTSPDKVDVVFLLRLAVHLFVSGAEHADVHVEIEDVGVGKQLFHLHRLLHARNAAHLGTVLLADLFVARTHAVQESDALGTRAVGLGHTAFVEHPLDVHRRKDVVVDAVAVLLLDRRVEQRESRTQHHRVARDRTPVGQPHALAGKPGGFGLRQHLDTALRDAAAQFGENLRRRGKRREQHVPAPEFAAQFGLLFDDYRFDALFCQTQGRLHARNAAAYDCHSFHYSLMSYIVSVGQQFTTADAGLPIYFPLRPRYLAAGSYSTPILSSRGSTST